MPSIGATMSNEVFQKTRRTWHRSPQSMAGRRESDRRGDEQGFTLLEVLVSGFLVGLIALAVAPMMLMAVQTSAASQEITELTAAGSQQMEILRGLPFTDAQLQAGGSVAASNAGYSLDPYLGNPDRYVRWQITDETADRKRIQLVVGERASIWGPPREVLLDTFRTSIQ